MHPLSARRALWVTLCCLGLLGCGPQEPRYLKGSTMGTTWSLQIADPISTTKRKNIGALIQHTLDALESELSHWRPDSDLSRWNQSTSTDWEAVPRSLAETVALAKKISQETEEALDVTAAPLIQLWGFGSRPDHSRIPSEAEIAEVLKRVGSHHLEVDTALSAIKKDRADVQINVASITEGYALDELTGLLKTEGFQNFLIEIGGEAFAIGHSPDGRPWRVGLQSPDGVQGETLENLPLTNPCISTSGSYRHRYEREGHTYSHIIDPRTGRPITHKLVSVTVINPRAVLADGYATALMVLGPEKGREVAQRLGLRVIWLEEE